MSAVRPKAKSLDINGTSFLIKDDGFVECRLCHLPWCPHVQDIIEKNADEVTLWSETGLHRYVVPVRVQVPIIPTSVVWMEVELEFSPKVNGYKVYMNEAPVQGEFLGFIHKGEGRNVLRSLFLDWFLSSVDVTGLRCKSSGHSYKAQKRWDSDMNKNGRVSQFLSVWKTGKCLGCVGPEMFDPDLIPDDDSKKASPWR